MRFVMVLAVAIATLSLAVAPALARSPGGHGQPNQSCEEQPSGPPGFDSGGFAKAELQYAGSGPGSAHASSSKVVSQYDVACFQVQTFSFPFRISPLRATRVSADFNLYFSATLSKILHKAVWAARR